MKITWNRVKLALLTLLVVIVAVAFLYDPLDYDRDPNRRLPADFQTYYQQQLEAGQQAGVRPGNEVRLVRFADRTEYTILFIHGFGASRAGGEAVVDVIANELQANTYYMRLPGHGTNTADHAAHDFREYLDATEDAFAMLPRLGDKIILIGSSTGALLTTYLASKYPDRVYAMIMASPLYEFANPSTAMFDVPGGIYVVEALYGPDRSAAWDDPRKQPGYEDHWQIDQKYRAVKNLADLRRYIVSDT
ncbi:MAG: alpha/beta fold hydrolase, partial [Leptospiraceae bacterium]|nr:alpha/beta fold hydrolase [Leptospiraceae bacterium]